jgi:phosphomannomutase/phosphoglucomutase
MTKLFGTDGVRGVTNKEMTPELALTVGQSFGTWLTRQSKGKTPKILVGTDPRSSRDVIKFAFCSGALATGCEIIDEGLLASPALQYNVKELKADAGAIITASHNPPRFNGIKLVEPTGIEMLKKDLERIEEIYFNRDFDLAPWNKVGKYSRREDGIQIYLEGVKSRVNVDVIRRANFKVIADCANGAGGVSTPDLMRDLGCRVVSLNAQPDGLFPNHDPEPIQENLEGLIKYVKAEEGDAIGIASDGDADRAIFIDEDGTFLYGDRILALAAGWEVKKHHGGKVVTAVSSSTCVEDMVKRNGGEVIYTPIGSPEVAHEMLRIGAVFGGEENGGLIFPEHQYCRDAAMSLAKVLEIMAETGKKLKELIKEVPVYSLFKTKVECPNALKEKAKQIFVSEIKKEGKSVETIDGAKVKLSTGWVLVRPSGTEPIFRIFSETKNPEESKKLATEYREKIEKIIKKLG